MKSLHKISVVTITYGHEKFIVQTLDGILMQNYSGEIELIIANDHSPDATDHVIKEYLEVQNIPTNFTIKYTKHEKNKGMMPNSIWALEQASGKYIALCEGDDYWTDPLKLQKQVDFLEENREYVACFHKYKELENNTFRDKILPLINDDFVITKSNFFDNWYTKTLTVIIRRENYQSINLSKYINIRDTVIFYELLKLGNAMCLNFIGGTYRIHEGGVWSQQNDKLKTMASYFFLEEMFAYNCGDLKLKKLTLYRLNAIIPDRSLSTYYRLLKNSKTNHFKIYIIKNFIEHFYRKLKSKTVQ